MWLMYGIPTIREFVNLPVMIANGVGILVELFYIYVFIRHAVGRRRKPVFVLLASSVVIFTVLGVFLGMTVYRHKWPCTFVGDLAAISGVVMYLIPIINTPFAALANGSIWTAYSRVGRVRMFILVPSIAAICSAVFQEISWFIVYFRGPPPAPVPPPPPTPPPSSDIELPPHAAAGTRVQGGNGGREELGGGDRVQGGEAGTEQLGGGDGGQGGEKGKEQLEAQVSAEGQQQLSSAVGPPAPEGAKLQDVALPAPEDAALKDVGAPKDIAPPAPEDAALKDVAPPAPPVVAPPLQPQEEDDEIPEQD
ncbi:bidirectional sugar transporter SWEET6b isoform X2 [Triticum aestivum]|uniref:bidirectional sugar transporter SWEET6b isoform X2 n=1 Tax=Triticum aestivum TaxID=4565 RepID=UPI001D02231F|nr:bidirectional sugar transporter SWEET6b-like isoform X2 [Triticum aestivum]